MNFIEPILKLAKLQPQSIAIIDGDRAISYRELGGLVMRTASHLASLGARPGDRVGVCLKDGWEHVVVLLAVGWMGAVYAPLDWRARPSETARIAGLLAIKFALVEPEFRANIPFPAVLVDAIWHRQVDAAEVFEATPCDWSAPFLISLSSGTTTGTPSFSLYSHLQYHFGAAMLMEMLSPPRHARVLSVRPLCFGSARRRCLAHLRRGDTIILHPPLVTAAEYVEFVRRLDANVGSVGPHLVRQLLQIANAGEYLLPSMVTLSNGGAPLLPEEKLAVARMITPNFFDNYATAGSGVVAVLRPGDLDRHAASVGQPHPLMTLEVVDEEHRPLPPGETGHLRCRGPGMGTTLTRPVGFRAGRGDGAESWYYPGEYASLDEEGFVFIRGRTSELITRGAAKIHPYEIESVLCTHPAVSEAAVVGRKTGTDAEEIVAFVVTRRPVEGGELVAHCRAHLTAYKVPHDIFAVDALPRTAAGKIDVLALRKRLNEDPTV